ncbi:hypothetical protein P170DRAFT_462441 [Aspergillus steynii IBT 23096]|uniref:Uncharacterized protein n=1 Tax=Aspergillus steynii IBT 23096 TaxID=1392250 RepID=A0A2I2GI16_9EURO|nr:uncharacterized protein P170DRAFT_462441 [Aspergillus steynii IBT 23096]PLB52521.1 hypothetical protein P170DRAFT_462441 [Aspergillus steynii IBT 23096]
MATFDPFLLTPLDHYLVVGGIGAYGCNYFTFQTPDADAALEALQTGAARLIRELPFLGGEVAPRENDPRHQLEVRPSGPDRFESHPMVTARRIDAPLPAVSEIGHAIDADGDGVFRPLPSKGPEEFKPVLRLQANMYHGGIILCFCWNHLLIDGSAVSNIMQAFARCCREGDAVSLVEDRRQNELARDLIFDIINRPVPEGYQPLKDIEMHELAPFSTEDICRETLLLSPDRVEELKSACNNHLASSSSSGEQGSYCATNDIVMALLWIATARASLPQDKRCYSMNFCVSMGKRAQPAIPASYMGSTLFLTGVEISRDELADALAAIDASSTSTDTLPTAYIPLLSTLAARIRAKIVASDDAHLTKTVHELHKIPEWDAKPGKLGDILFSNLSFNTCFQHDFGAQLGRIVEFEPRTVYPSIGFLKPRRLVAGGLAPWEMTVMFERERMEVVKKDGLLGWVRGDYL